MEAADELALGGAEDYGVDVVALGEDDGEGPVFGLSFGGPEAGGWGGESRDPTGAWELSELAGLVVQETKGAFDAKADGRHDVSVMEEDFDPDADPVIAVWAPTLPGAPPRLGTRRTRRPPVVSREYLPYGLIAGGLAALLVIVVAGVVGIALLALFAGPSRQVAPLDPTQIPKVEIERKPIEPQTADEILEEVLGAEGGDPGKGKE